MRNNPILKPCKLLQQHHGLPPREPGYSTKFYTERLRPDVQLTPYPMKNHFDRKGTQLFRIPSFDKMWYPFHIPSLELCIPF